MIFTMVLDLFLLQFVLGRGYLWSKLTGVTTFLATRKQPLMWYELALDESHKLTDTCILLHILESISCVFKQSFPYTGVHIVKSMCFPVTTFLIVCVCTTVMILRLFLGSR